MKGPPSHLDRGQLWSLRSMQPLLPHLVLLRAILRTTLRWLLVCVEAEIEESHFLRNLSVGRVRNPSRRGL